MAVIRVNKTGNYIVMSNYHLRDKRLTLKAKGLLSQMLSLPADWDYTIAGLTAINKENQSAITSALNELKNRGYLVITKVFPNSDNGGRIEYIYDIYEQPQVNQTIENQDIEIQGIENQGLEFQGIEKQAQLNNDKSIIDKINKDKKNKDKKNKERFIPPTADEVREYCRERKNKVDPERFVDYYTAKGWTVGKSPMKDWKAAVRTWEKSDYSEKQTDSSFDSGEFFEAAMQRALKKHGKL